MYLIKRFLAWLRSYAEIPLDEVGIQRFLQSPHNAHLTRAGTAALYRFLQMLREQRVVPPKKEQPLSKQQRLIKNYERYLLEERGLVQATTMYVSPISFYPASLPSSEVRASAFFSFVLRM